MQKNQIIALTWAGVAYYKAEFFGRSMIIYVKYMVSERCKMLVRQELKQLGIHFIAVELGTLEVPEALDKEKMEILKNKLLLSGLLILDDKKSILIEKIKNYITELIHYTDKLPQKNYSDLISEKLGYDYTYISNLFSDVKGVTVQEYIIRSKIERVKELLLYDELNLTQIADKLHYSSVSHLSRQFKKTTGLSPSYYKQLKQKRNFNLENM